MMEKMKLDVKKEKKGGDSDDQYPDLFSDSEEEDVPISKDAQLAAGMKKLGFMGSAMGQTGSSSRVNWLKLPDPSIIKEKHPIKSLILWDDVIITGNDAGTVSLYEKSSFKKLAEETFNETPVLYMMRQLHALIVQHKDTKGSVHFLRVWKSPGPGGKFKWQMKLMHTVETKLSSFVLCASTVLNSYTFDEGSLVEEHLTLVAPSHDHPEFPALWVLNGAATMVMLHDVLPIASNASEAKLEE